jgi:hypothetical protein
VKKDKNTEAFFALLRAGLWEKEARLSTYGDIDYSVLLNLAEEQSVVGLIAAGLNHVSDIKAPQEMVLQFVGEALQIEQQNTAMNTFIEWLIDGMRNAEIYALLIKGQGVAQCYEKPLWRTCGDVDLLLSEDNYKKAIHFLTPLASKVEEEIEFSKHIAMTIEGWEVELHGSLHGGLWKKMDAGLDEIKSSVFFGGNVRSWENGKTLVFLPREDEDVVYVFAHILEHFFYGGVGLRQICDWCRLLWTYRDITDKRLLKTRLEAMGALTEWNAFAAFAVQYLGMPVEALPLYSEEECWKRKAVRICNFIMEVGNFGHNRDRSYFSNEPFMKRKMISFKRHTSDGARHFFIFPMDSLRLWWKMLTHGMLAVVQRR